MSVRCLAVLVASLWLGAEAVYPDVYYFDVYSGEHLDDMTLPTDQSDHRTFSHTVVVVHQTECAPLITKYGLKPDDLPMSKNVLLLMHDYEISNSRIWYDYNGGDLRERFHIDSCLDVLFLPRGSTADTEPLRWNQEGQLSFVNWVWKQLEVPVTVNNRLKTGVIISAIQTGYTQGPMKYPKFRLAPGETRTMTVYESTLIWAYTKQMDNKKREIVEKHIDTWIVNGSMVIDVVTAPTDEDFEEIFSAKQRIVTNEDFVAMESAWNIMQRHLLNFKQPLIVPQFTEQGYKKLKVPEKWFKILSDFYHSNIHNRVNEGWTFGESIINQNEVQCSMVWLSEEVKERVADGLREILEEWAGCELVMTAFYGVREYFGGNILRNHVDRLETHVISAIIQIDKDLGDAEDWLLEVIEYSGNRSEVALDPGDMLLYESTRLIHGRPKPFRGKKYANVFLHYRPKFGWEGQYIHDKNGFRLYFPDQKSEPLMPLNTDLTSMYGYRRKNGKTTGDDKQGERGPGLRRDFDTRSGPYERKDEL